MTIRDDDTLVKQSAQQQYTYASTQATMCAGCGEHKHTPLRIDAMGGYVCLTCIDQKLGSLLGEFGYPQQQKPSAWHDKIKGMEVSMDVSTGEDDAHNRIYGRVYEVILEDGEGTPNAILAIEEDRNFTSPQPAQQEPVGEVFINTGNGVLFAPMKDVRWAGGKMPPEGTKLYDCPPASPSQSDIKPWVGLTDEDIGAACGFAEHTTASTRFALKAISRAIEAKLKEKNA